MASISLLFIFLSYPIVVFLPLKTNRDIELLKQILSADISIAPKCCKAVILDC